MDIAEKLMEEHPDSSLLILDSIDASSLRGNADKARYALLKSMALDKNHIDTTTFDVLQPAIDYYLKHGTPDQKLRTYYYQGRIFQNADQNDEALAVFMHATNDISHYNDTLTMANTYNSQGVSLYYLYQLDDFIKSNEIASNLYGHIQKIDYQLFTLNKVFDGYSIKGDKNKADSIFFVCKQILKNNPGLSSVNLSQLITYEAEFKPEELKDFLKEHASHINNNDDLMQYAYAYTTIGDGQMALKYLNDVKGIRELKDSLKYYILLSDAYEISNDYQNSLKFYKKYSFADSKNQQNIYDNNLNFIKHQSDKEINTIRILRNKEKLIFIIIVILLILLAVSIYFYFRNKMLKQEKINIEEKHKSDLYALELYKSQIDVLTEEKQELTKLIAREHNLSEEVKKIIRERLVLINNMAKDTISDNYRNSDEYDKWRDEVQMNRQEFMNSTRIAFKASHPGFIEFLESKNLDEQEINICALFAIGLKGKDIGPYIKSKRLYITSHEIREKLGIEKHQSNLSMIIRDILSKF